MLTQERIDHIWQAGYCRNVIYQCGRTEAGAPGQPERLKAVGRCVDSGCRECKFAVNMKAYEHDVAELCGPDALAKFDAGEDIRDHPEFDNALSSRLRTALSRHEIGPAFIHWMTTVANTRRNGYPYYDQDFGDAS